MTTLTPEQCRSARAWLGWSQDELAKAAKVGQSTVKDFENGKRTPIQSTLGAIQAVLEAKGFGFPFVNEDGVSYACGITFSLWGARAMLAEMMRPVNEK
jgi:transcriptional regulator with XRE-family HTH domain